MSCLVSCRTFGPCFRPFLGGALTTYLPFPPSAFRLPSIHTTTNGKILEPLPSCFRSSEGTKKSPEHHHQVLPAVPPFGIALPYVAALHGAMIIILTDSVHCFS
jgi:hypothetical protein